MRSVDSRWAAARGGEMLAEVKATLSPTVDAAVRRDCAASLASLRAIAERARRGGPDCPHWELPGGGAQGFAFLHTWPARSCTHARALRLFFEWPL